MSENIKKLYYTPYFDVVQVDGYYMIQENKAINGSIAVPVFSDGSLLLIEHFRPAIDKSSIEFPRGASDDGESTTDTALRELAEETGLVGKDAYELGIINSNSSLLCSSVAVVKVLIDEHQMPESRIELEGEAQVAVRYSLSHLRKLIAAGEITCGHTLSALMMLLVDEPSISLH